MLTRWMAWRIRIELALVYQGTPMLAAPLKGLLALVHHGTLMLASHSLIFPINTPHFFWVKNHEEKVKGNCGEKQRKVGRNSEEKIVRSQEKKKSLSFSLGNPTPKAPSFLHYCNLLWVRIQGEFSFLITKPIPPFYRSNHLAYIQKKISLLFCCKCYSYMLFLYILCLFLTILFNAFIVVVGYYIWLLFILDGYWIIYSAMNGKFPQLEEISSHLDIQDFT